MVAAIARDHAWHRPDANPAGRRLSAARPFDEAKAVMAEALKLRPGSTAENVALPRKNTSPLWREAVTKSVVPKSRLDCRNIDRARGICPEKWPPVFRRKCDQPIKQKRFPISVIGKRPSAASSRN